MISSKKKIELKVTDMTVNIKGASIVYSTGVEAPEGFIVLKNETGEYDMILCNPFHFGGEVKLCCKPVRSPARRYEIGDSIGLLLPVDGKE
jgi:hypothetical protein